jgi:hypothetical protein
MAAAINIRILNLTFSIFIKFNDSEISCYRDFVIKEQSGVLYYDNKNNPLLPQLPKCKYKKNATYMTKKKKILISSLARGLSKTVAIVRNPYLKRLFAMLPCFLIFRGFTFPWR